MRYPVDMTVNGHACHVEVEARTLLVHVLRDELGLTGTRRLARGMELSASAHYGWRTLDNPLTFAVVDVDRATSGAGARITAPLRLFGLEHRLSGGIDAQFQDDERLNFANCNFVPPLAAPTPSCPVLAQERGVVQLDQRERVSGFGPFVGEPPGSCESSAPMT